MLIPVYAQLYVGTIIMILLDSNMDFKYLNKYYSLYFLSLNINLDINHDLNLDLSLTSP